MLKYVKETTGWVLIALFIVSVVTSAYGNDTKERLFERVFGNAAKLDPDTVAKVKSMTPGERLYIDSDSDGKNDECWFIDTALRHTEAARPLLVRVVDEDGDMYRTGPDMDSDLYVADWKADGQVDVITDYEDTDGDNDVDEMGIYAYQSNLWGLASDKSGLTVWWSGDIGDDNQLWYDVNYNYSQSRGQFRCGFSGDEEFVKFVLLEDSENWVAFWEDPFLFFDPDKDGSSEMTLRFVGRDKDLTRLRYSIDADGDAFGTRLYDYDLSITALIDGAIGETSSVQLDNTNSRFHSIRGIPTGCFLRADKSKEFAKNAPWNKVCLTWDEINCNTQKNIADEPHERWEGIINHASKSQSFPQVGGPPCSPFNKRVEVSLNPVNPLQLYYDSTDHRIHLLGAHEGYIDVDYNLDGKIDIIYTYVDQDKNGVFEKRQIDLNADGKAEIEWNMKGVAKKFDLEYEPISSFYIKELAGVLAQSQEFIDTAKSILGEEVSQQVKDMEAFFLTKLNDYYPITDLGPRIRNTPAGARYYTDIIRDRLLYDLKQKLGNGDEWKRINDVYATGNYAKAAQVLSKTAAGAKTVHTKAFADFTHRIALTITNPLNEPRENVPVILSVNEIKSKATDFNPDNCAIVTPDRWIDWLEIPHQLDEIDSDAGREISFLADIPAEKKETWYLYYCPTGKRTKIFARKTSTDEDWVGLGENVGWESNIGAYRTYSGHFDFFGKKTYHHGKRKDFYIFPVSQSTTGDYHHEQICGIDALHVGDTAGIGGLTLYVKDKAYPVYGKDRARFTKRQIVAGPVRAVVEVKANDIIPDKPDLAVKLTCIIYDQHQESEIRAEIINGTSDMTLAPGLVKLLYENSYISNEEGIIATWGHQEDKLLIGDIGIGLIVNPDNLTDIIDLKQQRNLLCQTSDNNIRYWIVGNWREARRFPVAPTIDNWKKELRQLSKLLLNEVDTTVSISLENVAQDAK